MGMGWWGTGLVGVAILVGVLVGYVVWWVGQIGRTAAPIGKQPPKVAGLPWVGSGLEFFGNPTAFLERQRRTHGDTFLVQLFGLKLFFVFGGPALHEFYKFKESDASFAEATRTFLSVKVPDEVMAGSMRTVLAVLKQDKVAKLVSLFGDAVRHEAQALTGKSRSAFEIFALSKRLVHVMGFTAWCGREAASDLYLPRLIEQFAALDPEAGFKDMRKLVRTVLTRKRRERAALDEIHRILLEIWQARQKAGVREGDMLEAFYDEYAGLDESTRFRKTAVDVLVLHLASQSNLFAAMAWTLVNLLRYPQARTHVENQLAELRAEYGPMYASQVEALDRMDRVEACFMESIRLAQQSLTLRKVLRPVTFATEGYTVAPGYYVATLLSVTNTQDELLRNAAKFQPFEHYPTAGGGLAGVTAGQDCAISTFGHGVHACPGKKFAIYAAKIFVAHFLDQFRMELRDGDQGIQLLESQMGAVGRPPNEIWVNILPSSSSSSSSSSS